MHRTGKQERRAADAAAKQPRPGIGPQKKGAKRQRKGLGVALRVEAVVVSESDSDSEEEAEGVGDGRMSEDEEGDEDEASAAAAEITVLRDRAAQAEALVLAMQQQQLVLGEMKRMERIRKELRTFQDEFKATNGRAPRTADYGPASLALHAEYERLKLAAEQRSLSEE